MKPMRRWLVPLLALLLEPLVAAQGLPEAAPEAVGVSPD